MASIADSFFFRRRHVGLMAVLGLALNACASLPADHGRGDLQGLAPPGQPALTAAGITEPDWLARRITGPLSVDDAVEIAWRESPRIRTVLAELGLAGADLFESGRLRNPRLSAGRVGDETTIGLSLVISDLLTLPARGRIGRARWRAALADTAQALIDEAAAVRADYYHYIGADQVAQMRAAIAEAADTSAELARRFRTAGNISALQLAREEAAATVARTQAARARAERSATRMALAERLGLAGRTNRWRTMQHLPLPPADEPAVDELLTLARQQRHDLASARAALEAGEHELALTRGTRLLGEIEFGFEREHEEGERRSGPHLSLQLPLFQQGQASVARAQSRNELAHERVALLDLTLERQVRSGHARLISQREIIDAYRSALIPQRQTIVAGEQQRYNFMLIGAFELIAAKQQEYDTYQGYLEAIRDYWLARNELARSIGGPLPGDDGPLEPAPGIDDLLDPPEAAGHDHHRHQH